MEKEEQEQGKHVSSSQSEQVDYDRDLALAVSLQHEEGELTMLEASESEEDESFLSSSTDSDDANFFTSQELAEFELLEQEEEEEEDHIIEDEEDEIDPDELSYEDLVALGEIAGHENQGLSPEEISSALSPYICKNIQSNTGIDRCVICQVEYEEGEDLVNLRCDHPFHQGCINQWLQIKKICPICSKEAIKQKTE
ncbi:hypothetical protein V2J09_002343 [Rumex salicifolius]